MTTLDDLLRASAAEHAHLCPRQVLGVRMGLLAGRLLGLDLPQHGDKRLLTIAETDGCYVDGISSATGCTVGHRTLRIEDYGKVAAAFVDAHTERAIRIAPAVDARATAGRYAPEARNRWEAQLLGYQRMPDELLLAWLWVTLCTPVSAILSQPGKRVTCQVCHEEIVNEREVVRDGTILCRACAGQAYYRLASGRVLAAVSTYAEAVG